MTWYNGTRFNPATGRPWTRDEIRELEAADALRREREACEAEERTRR